MGLRWSGKVVMVVMVVVVEGRMNKHQQLMRLMFDSNSAILVLDLSA